MVCKSCIEKLAKRLVENHGLDYIDALTRAHKGIQRVSERKKKELAKIGVNPDYSQSCNATGNCSCREGFPCVVVADCRLDLSCGCSCPAPPIANSHYVSDDCASFMLGCRCVFFCLAGVCICGCSGDCYYDCDDGFEWNPVTSQCDLIPVVDCVVQREHFEYYLNFARRVFSKCMRFSDETLESEKESLKQEFILRGLEECALEQIIAICQSVAHQRGYLSD